MWFHTNQTVHQLVVESRYGTYSVPAQTSDLRLGIPDHWSRRDAVLDLGVDNATGEVEDGWGRPFYIESPDTGDDWIHIISLGANGIDEDGKGDDRAVSYGPMDSTMWSSIPSGIVFLQGSASWLLPFFLLFCTAVAYMRSSTGCKRIVSNAFIATAIALAILVGVLWARTQGRQKYWEHSERITGVPLLAIATNGTAINWSSIREFRDLNCIPPDYMANYSDPISPEWVIPVLQIRISQMDIVRPCRGTSQLFIAVPFASATAIALLLAASLVATRCIHRWRSSHRVRSGHCVTCAYNLTGLTEPRCPECGTPFEL